MTLPPSFPRETVVVRSRSFTYTFSPPTVTGGDVSVRAVRHRTGEVVGDFTETCESASNRIEWLLGLGAVVVS